MEIDFTKYPLPENMVWGTPRTFKTEEPGAKDKERGWWHGWIKHRGLCHWEVFTQKKFTQKKTYSAVLRGTCATLPDALQFLSSLLMLGVHNDEQE